MNVESSAIRAAYAECRRLARRHYENFPTASWLVPRDKRDALAAIYAFARHADDLADEPGIEGRLAKLAAWRQQLGECFKGRAEHPVFVALRNTIDRFRLSQENFENLLRAFESDVRVSRHSNFLSLLAYCTCSANSVGRLVLELFGHREPDLLVLSDDICTALQLTNFWQDVAVDFKRDRIYLPLDDLARFQYGISDLAVQRVDERWRGLLMFQIERTRKFFRQGLPLTEKVRPELRRQLRMTWSGGMAILAKIETVGCDVFRARPSLGWTDFLRLFLRSRRPLRDDLSGAALS